MPDRLEGMLMIARLFSSTAVAMAGLLLLTGVASAATVPGANQAAVPPSLTGTGTGMTLTVTSVKLVTRAAVNVKLSFVCDPLDENGTLVGILDSGGSVTVTEAVGKTLASTGSVFFSPGNVTCDSATVNHVTVLGVSTTVPFKAGNAVIQLQVSAEDDNFCCTSDRALIAGAIKIQK